MKWTHPSLRISLVFDLL